MRPCFSTASTGTAEQHASFAATAIAPVMTSSGPGCSMPPARASDSRRSCDHQSRCREARAGPHPRRARWLPLRHGPVPRPDCVDGAMTVHRLGLTCPDNPAHGVLLGWPTDRWGFFCPHADHGGNGRHFTTAEAEAGVPTPRRAADDPALFAGGATHQPDQQLCEAPEQSAASLAAVAGHPRPPQLHPAGTQPTRAGRPASGASGAGQLALPLSLATAT